MVTEEDGHNPDAGVAVRRFKEAIEGTDYYTVILDNINAQTALEGEIDITDQPSFNSDVFLYVGHGWKGYAYYDGTDILYADELPDMGYLDLVVWACCYSADDPLGGQSLATKTYNDGAETVIGWEMKIHKDVVKLYIEYLFENLVEGATVDEASDTALDAITKNKNLNVLRIVEFTTGLYIGGNKNNTIVYNANSTTASASAEASLMDIPTAFNPSKYTLIAENENEGLKVYVTMINGILVNDYYIEFYDNGVLTNVSKSAYTMTEADVMAIESQIEQMENSQVMMQNSAQSAQSEYLIQCVDGVWRLVERRSISNDGCDCCSQYVYYDVLTGEEVA